MTHTRLFTFTSMRRLAEQSGFRIVSVKGVAAPVPLALGDNWLSRALVGINKALIGLSKGLFSYQIFMELKPKATLEVLLRDAREQSTIRAAA